MQEQNDLWNGYALLAAGLFFLIVIIQSLFDLSWLKATLVGIGMFGVYLLFFFVRTTKALVLEQLTEDMKLVATTPERFPALNRTQLDVLTTAYMTLGFRPAGDYTFESPTVKLVPIFARLLWHAEHAVLLELDFGAPPNGTPLPLRATLLSVFGEAANVPTGAVNAEIAGPPLRAPLPAVEASRTFPAKVQVEHLPWAFGTTDREQNTMLRILAVPRNLGEYFPVGTTPQEMLRQHLARRDEVSAALKLPVLQRMNLDFYDNWCTLQRALMRRKVQHLNLCFALPAAFFMKKNVPFNVTQAMAQHCKAAERFPRT